MSDPFLTTKEIAATFRRSTRWAYSLRRIGLPMTGGVARLSVVEKFIQDHPAPTQIEVRKFAERGSICKNLQTSANRRD